jgi:hypothetical protein
MWTDRLKVLNEYNEILQYIESMHFFHDFRISNITMHEKMLIVMIEEDKTKNALIWNFTFNDISDLKFEIDCVLFSFVTEIEIHDNSVMIGLINGYISFNVKSLSIGIPKP